MYAGVALLLVSQASVNRDRDSALFKKRLELEARQRGLRGSLYEGGFTGFTVGITGLS